MQKFLNDHHYSVDQGISYDGSHTMFSVIRITAESGRVADSENADEGEVMSSSSDHFECLVDLPMVGKYQLKLLVAAELSVSRAGDDGGQLS